MGDEELLAGDEDILFDSGSCYRGHPETEGSSANINCKHAVTCRWFDDPNHLGCPPHCSMFEHK